MLFQDDVVRADAPGFLTGGGETGALIRGHDWRATPLGDPQGWPQPLKTLVAVMLSANQAMHIVWGAERTFLYNDAYSAFLGIKHPAAIGRDVLDVWHEIRADLLPLVEQVYAGRPVHMDSMEFVMHRKGYAEETHFALSYTPVRDEAGAVAGFFCPCVEITEQVFAERRRAEAEAALRESEARLTRALLASRLAAFEWEVGTGRVTLDARGRELFGFGPDDELTADEVFGRIHPDELPRVRRAADGAVAAGSRLETEYRVVRPDGTMRDLASLSDAEPGADGSTARMLGVFADATERRRAERALRELNETLERQVAARSAERDRLWNLSQDMFARADYSGMMSAVSPAWTLVLGWSEAELLTRGYATFMHPDDMPPTLEAIARMAETREPSRFENRIATRDGGWKRIDWTVAPEPDGANFIAVGRDVTAERERAAELAHAQDALRQAQKMEAMGQLTGGVAHDFNNLLTPIIGGLDMLIRRGLGNERERRLIDGALQSAERAKTLVQRLLAFARRQPLQPTAVDLGALVGGMVELIAGTIGPKVEMRVDLPPDLPPAIADANQIEMALLNLAVNARDAMGDGGVLTISAERRSERLGGRSGLRTGHYVRLAVADTGAGMDADTLARAVEPFFSTKGVGKGTGLGLSMVHGLAAQLGGELRIDSAPGRGTTVALWLPISAVAAGEEERPAEPAGLPRNAGTALLVDDEELVRMSTADMLADLGYDIAEAGSAEEALSLMDGGLRPDLLVTDHLMPGMSGAELARVLRLERPDLPVLLVSGYAEAEGIEPGLARLTKPFRNAELAASVAALMPGGGR